MEPSLELGASRTAPQAQAFCSVGKITPFDSEGLASELRNSTCFVDWMRSDQASRGYGRVGGNRRGRNIKTIHVHGTQIASTPTMAIPENLEHHTEVLPLAIHGRTFLNSLHNVCTGELSLCRFELLWHTSNQ